MGVCPCSVRDPHTQIAAGLEQLVILTRVTLVLSAINKWTRGRCCSLVGGSALTGNVRRAPGGCLSVTVDPTADTALGAQDDLATAQTASRATPRVRSVPAAACWRPNANY
jgi:hypothetical protein